MATRISERQLLLPALYLMSVADSKSVTTSQLKVKLEVILKPGEEDLAIIKGRKDSYFTQKVRNLKSHNTFAKFTDSELATYQKIGRDGLFTITKAGLELLSENFEFLRSVVSNDFQWDDTKDVLNKFAISLKKKRKINFINEDVMINEGYKRQINTTVYERSKKLRNAALDYYKSADGLISCKCCSFDFQLFYGNIGSGFIELHHTKPVFLYEDEDFNKKLSAAILNLQPVCSNCHRMIHRNWNKPLEVQELVRNIDEFGTYRWIARG